MQAANGGGGEPPRHDWRRRSPPSPVLAGSPELPFTVRFNLTNQSMDALLDWLAVVSVRCWAGRGVGHRMGCGIAAPAPTAPPTLCRLQVFTLLGFLRFQDVLYPAAYAWLGLHVALPLANIAWRRHSLGEDPVSGGSWGRQRGVIATVQRASITGWGCGGWRLVEALFVSSDLPRAVRLRQAGLAVSLLNFVFSSGACLMVLMWAKPLPIG